MTTTIPLPTWPFLQRRWDSEHAHRACVKKLPGGHRGDSTETLQCPAPSPLPPSPDCSHPVLLQTNRLGGACWGQTRDFVGTSRSWRSITAAVIACGGSTGGRSGLLVGWNSLGCQSLATPYIDCHKQRLLLVRVPSWELEAD